MRYSHEYDALDRLTHSTLAQGSPEVVSDLGRWQYDILGNRTRQTLADGRSLRYVYDEAGGQPQQAGAQQLRRIDLYSSAGALLGTDATLQWDADNRLRQSLTQVSNGSSTSTYDERYGYDAQGRRLVRQMLAGGTLYVSQYLYSGEDIVKEYGASWTLPVAAYAYGAGTDEALLVQSSAGTRYYHADGLGTPGLLTDEAGATYAWRRHDAWGRALGGAGTMPLYGYAGREPDPSSGLVFMRARYYDAALGRFISRDPIGLSGGLNVYAYVGNNPVNYVDPDGLLAKSVGNTLLGWGDTASRYFDSASLGLGGTRQNGATVSWRPSPYRQDAGVSAQTAIGLASAIPVVGVPFALVGAAMDIEQGNYGSAALNLAGAIPGVGMLRGAGRTADVLLDVGRVATREAGSIRSVNAIGGTMNCVNCAIATDATLAGRPASAMRGGVTPISVLERQFGGSFGAPTNIDALSAEMAAAGNGARGIVFGSRGTETGHVFNTVNQGGAVRFLDGQTGRAATFDGYKSFQLLRTN